MLHYITVIESGLMNRNAKALYMYKTAKQETAGKEGNQQEKG